MNTMDFLKESGISEKLIEDIKYFRGYYHIDSDIIDRIPKPTNFYYGKEVWEMSISALLEGENILLTGPKATGKNLLCDNLASLFERPQWNMSFHVNTDSSTLIGTDTFVNNEVSLRKGTVYLCAQHGGFGIFDEINMAKNDAIVVLHSALDYRRVIDVPGYDKIPLHEATRFIGTMNYDYAGTKDLNEALVSRFLVIDIPKADKDKLYRILKDEFPDADDEALDQFIGIFMDLQMKSENSEISTKSVDLRGIIAALKTIRRGLNPRQAIKMGVIGKTFDEYEKEIVGDIVCMRIPQKWESKDVFPNK